MRRPVVEEPTEHDVAAQLGPDGATALPADENTVGDAKPRRAARPAPEPPVEVPPAARWRVTRGGNVMVRGLKTMMREGKVVDELNYDVDQLRQQGIALERESG